MKVFFFATALEWALCFLRGRNHLFEGKTEKPIEKSKEGILIFMTFCKQFNYLYVNKFAWVPSSHYLALKELDCNTEIVQKVICGVVCVMVVLWPCGLEISSSYGLLWNTFSDKTIFLVFFFMLFDMEGMVTLHWEERRLPW